MAVPEPAAPLLSVRELKVHFSTRSAILGPAAGAVRAIPGNVPNPLALPSGCAFHPRCGYFKPGLCDSGVPPLEQMAPGRAVRCLRWREIEDAIGRIEVVGAAND